MKLFTAAALCAVALLSSGCSGCTTPAVLSNDHAVLQGQKVDEQAMGAVYALATAANTGIIVGSKAGLIDPATAAKIQPLKKKMGEIVAATETAYAAGNAVTFSARLKDASDLSNQISALVKGSN